MASDDEPGLGWRVNQIEGAVNELRTGAVSREWLDERLERIGDKIDQLSTDIADVKSDVADKHRTETQRRNGTYLAVVGAVLALAVSLLQQVPL